MHVVLRVDFVLELQATSRCSKITAGVLAAGPWVVSYLSCRLKVLSAVDPRATSSYLPRIVLVADGRLYRARELQVLWPVFLRLLLGWPEHALSLELEDVRLHGWVEDLLQGVDVLIRSAVVLGLICSASW